MNTEMTLYRLRYRRARNLSVAATHMEWFATHDEAVARTKELELSKPTVIALRLETLTVDLIGALNSLTNYTRVTDIEKY